MRPWCSRPGSAGLVYLPPVAKPRLQALVRLLLIVLEQMDREVPVQVYQHDRTLPAALRSPSLIIIDPPVSGSVCQ